MADHVPYVLLVSIPTLLQVLPARLALLALFPQPTEALLASLARRARLPTSLASYHALHVLLAKLHHQGVLHALLAQATRSDQSIYPAVFLVVSHVLLAAVRLETRTASFSMRLLRPFTSLFPSVPTQRQERA